MLLFLEGGCASGSGPSASSDATAVPPTTASPSSAFKEESLSSSSPIFAAYERARARAWDPSRRFKALFRAEVSPNIGAISRGYLSVWWNAAAGTLTWRSSAPLAGSGRGGSLGKGKSAGGSDGGQVIADRDAGSLFPGKIASLDLIACLLGTPDAPASSSLPFEETPKGLRLRIDGSNRSVTVDREGKPIELSFPNNEIVKLQPGEGVPRRIEANGPDGRAVLTLESFSSWPEGELVPPA
jgi:hypothetical protein